MDDPKPRRLRRVLLIGAGLAVALVVLLVGVIVYLRARDSTTAVSVDEAIGSFRDISDTDTAASHRPEPGVVDEQVHRARVVGETFLDEGHPGAVRQVRDQHLAPGGVGPRQLVGERLQPVVVAGDQDEVVAALGETQREGAPDPGGGSGDESDGSGVRR